MKKESLLSSWKEIASYLDRDISTCRRWEKTHGLPVNRIDEKSKSSVFAYKDEIDKWLEERLKKESRQKKFALGVKRRKFLYFAVPTIAILLILLFIILTYDTQPADFKIENSNLIILNQKGKELWLHDTGIENLVDEKKYREHFQFKIKYLNNRYLPHLIIKDINQDGKMEVLLSIQTLDYYGGGKLFCFDYKGTEMWNFTAGRKIKFGQTDYSSDFWIRGFDICDLDNNGSLEIILIAQTLHFFPTRLVILNTKGKVFGEYWNSGHLGDMDFVDLNENGKKEIIAVGQNNEYAKACIVVFNQNHLKGSSPQINSEYKCDNLSAGSELFYILLPRTDLDILESPTETIRFIQVQSNRQILADTLFSGIYFRFDFNLNLQGVRLSHAFERLHNKLFLEGKIKSELDKEKHRKELANGLLYYDGEKWANHHAMSNPWNNPEK
jgi:hypothetical protein